MFIGAYPEEEVNRFIDSILPTGAELDAKEAEQAAESGDVAAAERGFRDALAEDPENEDAALGLAKLLIDRGELDEARAARGEASPRARGRATCVRCSRSTTGPRERVTGRSPRRSGSRRPAIGPAALPA